MVLNWFANSRKEVKRLAKKGRIHWCLQWRSICTTLPFSFNTFCDLVHVLFSLFSFL
jgi:hypothetical protein